MLRFVFFIHEWMIIHRIWCTIICISTITGTRNVHVAFTMFTKLLCMMVLNRISFPSLIINVVEKYSYLKLLENSIFLKKFQLSTCRKTSLNTDLICKIKLLCVKKIKKRWVWSFLVKFIITLSFLSFLRRLHLKAGFYYIIIHFSHE